MSQWESIVESMPCAIIAINTERNVVAFNSNALKQFHQTEKSFHGSSCLNLLGSEICQQRCPLSSGKPFEEPAKMAIFLQTGSAGADPVTVEVRSLPWYDAEHRLIGCIHLISTAGQCRPTQNAKTVSDLSELGLLGASSLMHEVSYLIRAVAPTPSTVLIQGETGTGKEIVAHIIESFA